MKEQLAAVMGVRQ